jgi:hypothetical protein
MVQTGLGGGPIKKKVTKVKRGMGQVVEHLPCKYKALSSSPSTAKNKNKKRLVQPSKLIRVFFPPVGKGSWGAGGGGDDAADTGCCLLSYFGNYVAQS